MWPEGTAANVALRLRERLRKRLSVQEERKWNFTPQEICDFIWSCLREFSSYSQEMVSFGTHSWVLVQLDGKCVVFKLIFYSIFDVTE